MLAKKSLGQHFLHNQHALDTIIESGDIQPTDIILEIGPGHGVLTKKLLFFAGKVVAIEKDRALVEELSITFAKEIASGKLELIEKDILDFDPGVFAFYRDLTYKVIANIPYNITGAIVKHILSASCVPEQMVLLVQKEVAERIIAKDNKESILSIAVKAYGNPKIIAKVGRGSFAPPPRVDSAILSIEKISKSLFTKYAVSEKHFFNVLRTGFAHKRKVLIRNLTSLPMPYNALTHIWQAETLSEQIRAEDIDLETWFRIAKNLLQNSLEKEV